MADTEKTENCQRQLGICRIVIILLCIVIMALIIALAIIASKLVVKQDPEMKNCPSRDNNINLNPPEVLSPFHDLTGNEISSIRKFLYKRHDLNLVASKDIATNTSYIFTMELLIPNKALALDFLDNGGSLPIREAHVVVFRGDKPEPSIEEFVVGPLPNPTYITKVRTRPFIYRPITKPEVDSAINILNKEVHAKVGNIIKESYGGSMVDCGDKCVAFQLITPMSTVTSGESGTRKTWFWLLPDVEFRTSHGFDFFVLMDLTSQDEEKHTIDKVSYSNQKFESLEELQRAYESGTVEKTRISFPDNNVNLYSSMNRRGKLFPDQPLSPPIEFEPDGKRYMINGRHIKYMNWDFDVRMSTIFGPQIFDIRYNNERIVYELSLQDAAAFYSGHSPAIRFADYVDSFALIGTRVRSLVAGADCPSHSTFLSADHVIEADNEPMHVDRAFCVFEHNTGFPLRRHHTSSGSSNKFYEGMADIVFTVRTIATVVNYDYIFDFIFHQNGAIEVKSVPTGYILTSKRTPSEDPYGFRLRDHVTGNLHHHMFNYKVDLDIHGRKNTFETIKVVPETSDNSRWSAKNGAFYSQTKMERHQVQTEKEAAIKYEFDSPKYLTFYSNRSSSEVPRAYRLFTRGMSKQMVAEGTGAEPSISWARYQVAVTKYKESEKHSSSMYASYDGEDPVVDFQSFIEDDEVIEDEDQVVWVTLGIHHIPHMEDFPTTPTVGLDLSFFLLPYNYFDEDPAMGSSDAIRIEPKNQTNINDGLKINRYGVPENPQCMPRKFNFDLDIENEPSSIFDEF